MTKSKSSKNNSLKSIPLAVRTGKAFSFIEKDVRLPNGHRGTYLCIDHRGAVAVIPLISKNKVVLIRQFRIALEKYIWEIPAGTLDINENPVDCAKRELIEEIGYETRKLKKLGFIYPAVGYSNEKLFMFAAYDLKKTVKASEADEIIMPKIFTKPQVIKMIKDGKIVDSKTISAFALIGWI